MSRNNNVLISLVTKNPNVPNNKLVIMPLNTSVEAPLNTPKNLIFFLNEAHKAWSSRKSHQYDAFDILSCIEGASEQELETVFLHGYTLENGEKFDQDFLQQILHESLNHPDFTENSVIQYLLGKDSENNFNIAPPKRLIIHQHLKNNPSLYNYEEICRSFNIEKEKNDYQSCSELKNKEPLITIEKIAEDLQDTSPDLTIHDTTQPKSTRFFIEQDSQLILMPNNITRKTINQIKSPLAATIATLENQLSEQKELFKETTKLKINLLQKRKEAEEALNVKITSLEASLLAEQTSHNTTRDNLETQKNALKNSIAQLRDALSLANANLTLQTNNCSLAERGLSKQKDNVAALETQLEAEKKQHTEEIATLQQQVSTLAAELKKTQDANTEFVATVASYETIKQNLTRQLSEAQKETSHYSRECLTAKEESQIVLKAHKKILQEHEECHKANDATTTKLKQEIETLKQETQDIKEKSKNETSLFKKATWEKKQLQKTHDTLTTQYKEKCEAYDELTKKQAELFTKFQKEQNDHKATQTQLTANQSHIHVLTEELKTTNSKHDDLMKSDAGQLSADNTALKEKLAVLESQLKEKLAALESQLKEKQDDYKKHNAETQKTIADLREIASKKDAEYLELSLLAKHAKILEKETIPKLKTDYATEIEKLNAKMRELEREVKHTNEQLAQNKREEQKTKRAQDQIKTQDSTIEELTKKIALLEETNKKLGGENQWLEKEHTALRNATKKSANKYPQVQARATASAASSTASSSVPPARKVPAPSMFRQVIVTPDGKTVDVTPPQSEYPSLTSSYKGNK